MNDAQIENWRKVLVGQIGVYALIMSKEEIIALRDRIQAQVDAVEHSVQSDEFCTCDPKKHGYTRHMNDTVTCNKCGKTRR